MRIRHQVLKIEVIFIKIVVVNEPQASVSGSLDIVEALSWNLEARAYADSRC